jgi:hypothetical protein
MSGIQQMLTGGTYKPAANYFIGVLTTTGVNTVGYGTAVDSLGNMYVAGTNNGFEIVKYDATGTLLWQKIIGVSGSNNCYSVAVGSSGNVYISGTSYTSYNGAQIIKLDSSGNIIWQKQLGPNGTNYALGLAMVIDSSENVYVGGGYYNGSDIDFLTAKYNSSGTLQWQKWLAGGYGTEEVRSVSVDSSGNVYILGNTYYAPYYKPVIAKYNSSGTLQWQKFINVSSVTCFANSVTVDSSGNIYLGANNDSGMVVIKLNSSGVIQWQKQFALGACYPNSIKVDSSGYVYICGSFNFISSGRSIGILKYNSAGIIQWQRELYTYGAVQTQGLSIDLNNMGTMYISGDTALNYSTSSFLFAKLPTDGSKTGSYSVGSYSIEYRASSGTDSMSSWDISTSSLGDYGSPGLPNNTSTLTGVNSTLTSSVVTI